MSGYPMQNEIFQHHTMVPIPPAGSMNGWQAVPIFENGEPLVDVTSFATDKIIASPIYYERLILGSLPICYVRESVGQRLAQASYQLPDGWKLVVFDAWRPTDVQAFIYYEFVGNLRREHSDWTDQEILTHAQTYVSLPSTDLNQPSPHLTGGAVDLSISDDRGVLLDMGTEFDAFLEEARMNYFEELSLPLSIVQERQRDNRRFLYHLLIGQGFTNYSEEWWHFDFGNQFWAQLTKQFAIFSLKAPK